MLILQNDLLKMNTLRNILTYSCIIGIFALHPGLNKGDNFITDLQYHVYGNSLELLLNSEINPNHVSIVWKSAEDNSEVMIYQNGKELNKIPSITGKQKIMVYYNYRAIGKIDHYRTQKNQAHKYYLSINAKNKDIFFKGEITGPSAFKSPAITTLSLASL